VLLFSLHNVQLPVMLAAGNTNLLIKRTDLTSELDQFTVSFSKVNDRLDGFGHGSFS
jgi:hypothetical protein